jgi:hypothetical protein
MAAPWDSILPAHRRFITAALVVGFASMVLTDVLLRLQLFTAGPSPSAGIEFFPMDLWAFSFGGALIASVGLVFRFSSGTPDRKPLLLGSLWLLALIPLSVDYLIDSFEVKIPVMVLFAFAAVQYWKGSVDNPYAFVLAPLVSIIVVGDGLGHLGGAFCPPTGLDSCSAKAVSDLYLSLIMIGLTIVTLTSRSRRPSRNLIVATVLVWALLFGLALVAAFLGL